MDVEEIRVAIVDAKQADREHMRSLLASEEDIQVVAEWCDGAEALSSIGEMNPDILFLDADTPKVDGFELVKAIGRRCEESLSDEMTRQPAFVFVTTCQACAVKAFDVRALDFVLKPVAKARFEQAVERARDYVRESRQKVNAPLLDLIGAGTTPPTERHRPNRVIIRSSGRVLFLRPEEIDWLEAAGNYLRVHARGASHPLRVSMKNAESCLDPWTFLRIHRSAIVNVDRIRDLTPWKHGEYVVTMHDGTQLHASRQFTHRLEAFIESYGLGGR
jgi:two-component system LytT family response regulator